MELSTMSLLSTLGICGLACLAAGSLCATASANTDFPTPFTEEARIRGVEYTFGFDGPGFGVGVGFADFDMDGDPDIVLVGNTAHEVGIFENTGLGQFADRSETTGLAPIPNAVGIATSDYDADGDIDVFISVHGDRNALLRNDGNFHFVNVAVQAGVGHAGFAQGAAWGDYDRDGWLDLYVSNRREVGGGNLLYRNLGDGTFEELAAALGVDMSEDGLTFHASFFDYNDDRKPDIYLCTDKGDGCLTDARNHLFENQGTTFVEVTDETGTDACVACMGTAIGDFDANGHTDLYCTNLPFGNALMLNQGDGTFRHGERDAGVESFQVGWGSLFLDYDNDTFLDLYVCNVGPNRLFDNDGTFPCPDVAASLRVATNVYSHSVALADIDLDGDLDMLVEGFGVPVQLFVNHEGSQQNWLQVKLFGNSANTHAIGARVDIRAGGRTQFRELRSGVGFKSSSSLVIPFGLDDAEIVDEVRVEWPLGGTTLLTDVPVNQRLIVQKGARGPRSRPPLPR